MHTITYSRTLLVICGKERRDMRDRRTELIEYCCNSDEDKIILLPLVDEVIFLENRLEDLKKLPFIKVNPKNPMQQKSTPAQKQYKELLQQYTNIIKVLTRATGHNEGDEESPLRKWVKGHVDTGQNNLDT